MVKECLSENVSSMKLEKKPLLIRRGRDQIGDFHLVYPIFCVLFDTLLKWS